MHSNYSPQLNIAINAALAAGKVIMKYYSRLDNLKVQTKGYNDYVSEADQESENNYHSIFNKSISKLQSYCRRKRFK